MNVLYLLAILLTQLVTDICSSSSAASKSSVLLYDSSDQGIFVLSGNNFWTSVLGSQSAWVVEFYNSWCGHCIHFAPTWKEFAQDIKDWKSALKVGVIDCADEANVEICREYEIMAYPTARLFGAQTVKGDLGVLMKTGSVNDMKKECVDFIVKLQAANNGSASTSWVNLQPYEGAISDLGEEAKSANQVAAVIVDSPSSYVAKETILDFSSYRYVLLRRMVAGSGEVRDLSAASLPAVIFLEQDGKRKTVSTGTSTRKEITQMIKNHFNLGLKPPFKSGKLGISSAGAPGGNGYADSSDKINTENGSQGGSELDGAVSLRDKVYLVDIENAIAYALKHEVALKKEISLESLSALKQFLHVVRKYLPLQKGFHSFIMKLEDFLLGIKKPITGEEYSKKLESLNSRTSFIPDQQQWIGCHGSTPKYRGYPCGLWVSFHTMTVSSVIQDGNNVGHDPKEVLRAVHAYVKNFFSCSYCSAHFQEMYALDAENYVRSPESGVMWLWKGHNKVNKRLHGSDSEDPEHIKQQFPIKEECPACWKDGVFNEVEVLAYLKRLYDKSNILTKFHSESSSIRNRQAKVFDTINKYRSSSYLQRNHFHQTANDTYSWVFTKTDLSLCVMLYGASAVILITIYIMFLIKRKLRRKRFLDYCKSA